MDLSEIYTDIINEHSTSARNKHPLEGADMVLDGVNPSCGDEIQLMVNIADGKISQAAFTGSGCAISQASTSLMIDLIVGKPVEEARELLRTFIGMIKREITDEQELERLEEAIALRNISNMPARVKCAVLAWHTLEDALAKQAQG